MTHEDTVVTTTPLEYFDSHLVFYPPALPRNTLVLMEIDHTRREGERLDPSHRLLFAEMLLLAMNRTYKIDGNTVIDSTPAYCSLRPVTLVPLERGSIHIPGSNASLIDRVRCVIANNATICRLAARIFRH